jgi:hypothetical protein
MNDSGFSGGLWPVRGKSIRHVRAEFRVQEALRFTAFLKVSSIRDCQPGPVDLKWAV